MKARSATSRRPTPSNGRNTSRPSWLTSRSPPGRQVGANDLEHQLTQRGGVVAAKHPLELGLGMKPERTRSPMNGLPLRRQCHDTRAPIRADVQDNEAVL